MKKIYLRYASDIHLEMYGEHFDLDSLKIAPLWNFKSDPGDTYYLALTGDIGNPFHKNLLRFFDKITEKYAHIFYLFGNHELYSIGRTRRTYVEQKKELQNICSKYHNIHILDNDIVTIDGINFIGSTLWSYIPSELTDLVASRMNDYKYIYASSTQNISVADSNKWNADAVKFLIKSLDIVDGPVVIMTHHAPLFNNAELSIECADPRFNSSQIQCAYHNDLTKMITDTEGAEDIILWIYGHTHHTSKFDYHNITFVTNQFGYSTEITNFSPFAKIELNNQIMKYL